MSTLAEAINAVLQSDKSNTEKLQLVTELKCYEARRSFHAFRRLINPKLIDCWFTQDLSRVLQQFVEEWIAGKRPKYVIEAPPQHGKSIAVIDLIAWVVGKYPEAQIIFASFSERLGYRANLRLRRILKSERYRQVFPGIPAEWGKDQTRTMNALDIPGHTGIFRNTTVEGSITGESLDVGIIDDPIKGRKDANSKNKRDSTWDWFTDDFLTRFADNGAFLCVLTRWHIDDVVGRVLDSEDGPDVKVFKYPALADSKALLLPHDPRKKGSNGALMPEHKSKEFLLGRKAIMAEASWMSLYQANPQIPGGEIIRGEWFGRYLELPPLKYRAMYGDTAQKGKTSSDYQVLVLAGLGKDDGKLYIIDVLRGKFDGAELETRFPDFWRKHLTRDTGRLRYMAIEDKSSGTVLIQKIRKMSSPRIPVKAIPRDTDKYSRVQDVLGYIKSGWVMLPENAPWVHDFIAEMEEFTADDSHAYDDQVDVTVDAIENMLFKSAPSLAEVL